MYRMSFKTLAASSSSQMLSKMLIKSYAFIFSVLTSQTKADFAEQGCLLTQRSQ